MHGRTRRGTTVSGAYRFDEVRKTYQYELNAYVPPFFEAITGIVTGAAGRTVVCRGEATPFNGGARFSFDFAGRAIDVQLRRIGPVETAPDLTVTVVQREVA